MKTKIVALIEVVAVFAITLTVVAVVGASTIGTAIRNATDRAFLEYAAMIAVPLAVLLVSKRGLLLWSVTPQPPISSCRHPPPLFRWP
jgi:hypothetical protein